MGRWSKYPEEFQQRAAQLVLDSRRSVRNVAAELGINHETLRNWVAAGRRQRADGPAALSADEQLACACAGFAQNSLAARTDRVAGRGYTTEQAGAPGWGAGCGLRI